MGLRIIILGPPGAGKGTQAKRIAAARKVPHISTGDIFRAYLGKDRVFDEQVMPYMEMGALVPDELTCATVEARLSEADCRSGYVLDGFPRSVAQAEALERLLSGRGERVDVAINLEVPDDAIMARLSARRTCPVCGTIYNLKFDPPKGGGKVCSRNGCTGGLVQRPDDNEETVRQRLAVYHRTTAPIIEFYRARDVLRTVRGEVEPEAVFAKVEDILCALEVV